MNFITIDSKEYVFKKGMVVYAKDLFNVEDKGETHHPYVILSNIAANGGESVVACMLSTNISRLEMPWNVLLQDYSKLELSIIKGNVIYSLPKSHIEGYITTVRPEDLLRVDRAMRSVFDLREKEIVIKSLSSSGVHCVTSAVNNSNT